MDIITILKAAVLGIQVLTALAKLGSHEETIKKIVPPQAPVVKDVVSTPAPHVEPQPIPIVPVDPTLNDDLNALDKIAQTGES